MHAFISLEPHRSPGAWTGLQVGDAHASASDGIFFFFFFSPLYLFFHGMYYCYIFSSAVIPLDYERYWMVKLLATSNVTLYMYISTYLHCHSRNN